MKIATFIGIWCVTHGTTLNLSFAEPRPQECSVLDVPSPESLLAYAKGGPYSQAIRFFTQKRFAEAARSFESGWRKVRLDLASAFSTSTCEPRRIRAVLTRTVLRSPPLAVPGDDRFLPPPAIRDALAFALCETGQVQAASEVLWEASLAGDEVARVSAGVLFAASGRADLCLSLLPDNPSDPTTTLARIFCLLRADRADEARDLASRATNPSGPKAEALLRLIRSEPSFGAKPPDWEEP